MVKNILLIVILFGCAAIYYFCRKYSRIKPFKDREIKSLEEIYETEIKQQGISRKNFVLVFEAVGKFYNIKPELLRSTDTVHMLTVIDSWELGHGTEQMEEWLYKSMHIKSGRSKLVTIMDILSLVEQSSCNK